jgi:hypothetical protein
MANAARSGVARRSVPDADGRLVERRDPATQRIDEMGKLTARMIHGGASLGATLAMVDGIHAGLFDRSFSRIGCEERNQPLGLLRAMRRLHHRRRENLDELNACG